LNQILDESERFSVRQFAYPPVPPMYPAWCAGRHRCFLGGRTEPRVQTECSIRIGTSALGKNRPFALTKSDPHEEHDLPVGKEKSDIIHAEGVRFAVASSAQRGPWKAVCRQEFIGWACGPNPSSHRDIAAWQAAVAGHKRQKPGTRTYRWRGSLLASNVWQFLASAEDR
jgi:hypothetical protein